MSENKIIITDATRGRSPDAKCAAKDRVGAVPCIESVAISAHEHQGRSVGGHIVLGSRENPLFSCC